jgi:hypothetical protein
LRRQYTEEERDGEHGREEQRGTEPMQEASGGTHRATQRKSEEEAGHSKERKRGKQKRNRGIGMAEYKRWEWRTKGYRDNKEERWRQIAKERWEKEARKKEKEGGNDADEEARGIDTGGTEGCIQEETEKSGAHYQRKRTTETRYEDGNRGEHDKRQRGTDEQNEQRGQEGGLGGDRHKRTRRGAGWESQGARSRADSSRVEANPREQRERRHRKRSSATNKSRTPAAAAEKGKGKRE